MTRWELFGRGFLMPCLVTANAVAAVGGSWWAVLVLGFTISWIWSGSVRALAAACSQPADRFSYALGASGGGCVLVIAGDDNVQPVTKAVSSLAPDLVSIELDEDGFTCRIEQ